MTEVTVTIDLPSALAEKVYERFPTQQERIDFIIDTFRREIINEEVKNASQQIDEQAEEEKAGLFEQISAQYI